jgi:hypothetical protein
MAQFEATLSCMTSQQATIKRHGFTSTNIALLVTGIIAAGGGIVTAAVASHDFKKADQTTTDTGPITVAAASVAGATSLGLIVSAFIKGNAEEVNGATVAGFLKYSTEHQAEYAARCGAAPIPVDNEPYCISYGVKLRHEAVDILHNLPWDCSTAAARKK